MYSPGSTIDGDSPKRLTRFLVGQVHADLSTNLLTGAGGELRLEPRVMEVLCQLAESAGQVVLREDMLDEHGSDEGITRAISILRKSLKKLGGGTKFIQTIPKRGYRLLAEVIDQVPMDVISVVESSPERQHLASLAVLSFSDLSENQDQGYLSDGISEEIMNCLAKLPFLRVSGRTSSFSFKGSKASVSHISNSLNVSHVLDGSVRKFGERLRISAQLIEAATDKQIWTENFDGQADELFDLQDTIAHSVKVKFQSLFGVEPAGESQTCRRYGKPTQDREAYNEFLVGRHLMYELSGQRTIPRAITAFENATAKDANFASAWAHLAIANFTLPEYSTTDSWRQHIESARTQIAYALSLDSETAWSHRAKASMLSYDHKFDEAILSYQKGLSLEPNDPELLFTNGYIFSAIGLQKEAQRMMLDALEREPLLGSWYGALGTTYFAAGDLDQAQALFEKSFQCNFGYGAMLYAQLLTHRGNTDEALEFLRNNFDGLGPVLQSQLSSPIVRELSYAAFFKRSKLARKLVDGLLTRRMNNPKIQPALGNILGFILIGRPEKFFQHILEKPNPYVGFALSRIWEPTQESQAVRMHKDFPMFAEKLGLVKAWQRFGWPDTVKPHPGTDGSNGQFSCG